MKLSVLAWLVLGFLAFSRCAQAGVAPNDALNSYVERALREWQVPGAAVAIVRDGEIVFARGFGVRQIGRPARIDEHTLFYIGSTTKAFTATALGMLVDEGKLRWDDPVVDHLPWFRLADPWLTQHVTVRDVLSHRSGLAGNQSPWGGNPWAFTAFDARETVRRLRYAPLPAAFRQEFLYSNLGYAVAGQVIESVSGASWRQFIQQRLLDPLQMSETGTSPAQYWSDDKLAPCYACGLRQERVGIEEAFVDNIAMPHEGSKVIPWRRVEEASGAIVSNVTDMSKWLSLHLDAGQAGAVALLKPDTLRELHRPAILLKESAPWDLPDVKSGAGPTQDYGAYALGWNVTTYRGHRVLYHGGGVPGMPAFVTLLPDQNIGVVVLANGRGNALSYTLHQDVTFQALDLLLGLPARDWRHVLRPPESTKAAAVASSRPQSPPALPLQTYVGTYEEPQVGIACVEQERDGLALRMPSGLTARLVHVFAETFRVDVPGGHAPGLSMSFELDPAGRLTGASLRGVGRFARLAGMAQGQACGP